MGEQRHRVDAVRQRAHVRTSRARGERARLERVRHVADEDGDRGGWQHTAVEELGRESEDRPTEGVDQQQLNEIVEGEAEEPVYVPADDPTHTPCYGSMLDGCVTRDVEGLIRAPRCGPQKACRHRR